ncbi:MAG: hypothetical protein IPO41_05545 [Acidobacteria bacterium]|nr:hypothetical protein [Acidobacteriota bacterium]
MSQISSCPTPRHTDVKRYLDGLKKLGTMSIRSVFQTPTVEIYQVEWAAWAA